MPERLEVDLLIIGAGPVGLFAAYYAGFRSLSVALVDSLPEIGGQISAMYPEKVILDVAGFPTIKGRELVANLGEQADRSSPTYLLERTASSLVEDDDAGTVTVGLDDGTDVVAKAVIISAGIGKFTPRELPAANEWEGDEVAFFVPSFDDYVDRDVVIVGGGDSAFDWALHLEPVARSVTLIHRRDAFRAHQSTVDKVLASRVNVMTSANVAALIGESGLEAVDVESVKTGDVTRVKAQRVVAALGFIADLSAMATWGLEQDKRHIVVDPTMRTNLARVFAAGDIVEYPGKVRLIAVGFGEAATAVNNAAVAIDPSVKVFPGHSSEGS
jgi:thioredoxin reductase (NADPH)